jgi:oligopeptidase B
MTTSPLKLDALEDVSQAPVPPVARKLPRLEVVHGQRRVDDYFWLREKSNPEVLEYLEAENRFTAAAMAPTRPLQDALYKEMLGRIQETDLSVPFKDGGYLYYTRTEEGRQYPLFCRRPVAPGGAEEITLDVNELAQGQRFMAVGTYAVTDDGRLLAYSTDHTGFREYTLHVKDLATGTLLPLEVEAVGTVAWAADDRTLFYTTEDSAKRSHRLWRHRIGSGAPSDELVYEEHDELFRVFVGRTRSKDYLVLGSASHTTAEMRYLRADQPLAEWSLVAPRQHEHEYDLDHHGDFFYIRTNDQGRNFRLVKAPVADPRPGSWQEVVPHRPFVMLEGVELFRNHCVLLEREQGLPEFRVVDLRTGAERRVAFPEPAYSAYPDQNAEFDTPLFRYGYESLVTPRSVFDYDMERGTSTLLKEQPVLGGYDRARYVSERVFATARDGVTVPVSIVYRQDRRRDGGGPLLLTGYGSYGYALPVAFSSNRFSLIDRGVAFAIAHVRGGGEMGKAWHDDGRMRNKKNTFTDFIAAAERLIAEGYTAPDRLAIQGGSAGGLLMGAVTNMRPDLFRAVVSKVPFVDVINTMLDASLPLTAGEWEEWGDPRNPDEYEYMLSYSPYDQLQPRAYPAMLVTTALNDSQVMYWEPAKYVARLRAIKTDRNALLLKTNLDAGHGGASGRYDYLHEVAFDYAFILTQLGIARQP